MLRMRRRRVVGAVVGTAVIAGTAGAVRHHQDQKYAAQDAANQPQYEEAPQPQVVYVQAPAPAPAPVAAPAPAASAGTDMMSQLTQLSQLHNAGVLSDEEFTAAKAKLLAS